MLTNAGGLGILCADACEAAGPRAAATLGRETASGAGRAPARRGERREPGRHARLARPPRTYAAALPPLLADPRVDAADRALRRRPSPRAQRRSRRAVEAAARAAGADKPVLAVVMSAEGIPGRSGRRADAVAAFAYPESAARALGRAADARRVAPRGRRATLAELDGIDAATAARRSSSARSPAATTPGSTRATRASCSLAYGIPLVAGARRRDHRRGRRPPRRELGFPVVVKTRRARRAQDRGRRDRARPSRRGRGAGRGRADRRRRSSSSRWSAGGAELLAGVVQDPVFGPLVAFGPGGVFAELIGEAAFRIAPLTDADADELVLGGKAGRLVARLPRRAGRRRGCARRPRPAARAPRRRPPGGRRARPQPGPRAPRRCVAVDARVRVARPEHARGRRPGSCGFSARGSVAPLMERAPWAATMRA